LFWAETFWPTIGGAEVLAGKLLRSLRERGHDCVVVAEKYPDQLAEQEDYDGIPVYRLPFGRTLVGVGQERSLDSLLQVRRALARLGACFEPDIVHAYFVERHAIFLQHTARVQAAPVLATLHHVPDRSGECDTSIRATLRSADWVAACSAAVLDETRRRVPEIAARSSVVSNSLELPTVCPRPLPFDPPRLLCLGRIVQVKGFDLALAAFAMLADRYPRLQLDIAGDGPARPALKRQAAELGLVGRVRFLGWVDPEGVPALLNTATMVIMPSRWEEPFGLVALQAAQMGRPVVATRVGGLPEVVMHGQTGLLVDKEDPTALAAAIASLLSDPPAARWIGEAARHRARNVFNWERHVDAYDALYRALVAAGPGTATGARR